MVNSKNILETVPGNSIYDIAVIGGVPSGIMAAISAKTHNKAVKIALLEKNKKIGRKLLLTGNGRCNFTTSINLQEILNSSGRKGRFFLKLLIYFQIRI